MAEIEVIEVICVVFVPLVSYLLYLLLFLVIYMRRRYIEGQKTRTSPTRRMYVGSRQRSSLPSEPTIYVSPNNLPPPPKYEAMAPPSYEEVVGIHYPNYQVTRVTQIQPITQPITAALAGTNVIENNVTNSRNDSVITVTETVTPAVITVTEERRTSLAVAASS